ncbi:MAG: polyprenyl synthetase family protein [Aaplasma endosymbiont of Hyalomma asiaticum]
MDDPFSVALNDLKLLVADELQEAEDMMSYKGCGNVEYITNVVQHLILSGGKRTRPSILLAVCRLLGCTDPRRVVVAAAIEYIHNATLLHDDVVDRSEIRRGKQTSNSIWGNKASILVGDFLFAVAFQWIVSCDSIPLLSVLSKASSTIITGEIQQMIYSDKIDLSRAKYFEIISSKTAALFAASCEAAAVLHDVETEMRTALRDFGFNFGIVFQILDDILDYTSHKEKLGKQTLNDLNNEKITIPIILTYEDIGNSERAELRASMSKESQNPELVLSYITKNNSILKCLELAKQYASAAKKQLSLFPDSQCKHKLIRLLDSAVERQR